MFRKLEDLSIELWLEIFSYLKLQHQFKAFFNLNQRLNQILFSYRTQVSYKNNDDDTQYLFKNILPYLTHRENVTGLRLENIKSRDHVNLEDRLHFPCLKQLILHRLTINQDFLNLFRHNTNHLRYLNISSLVSGDKRSLHKLLEMILSLPNLQICRMRLGIGMSPIPLQLSVKSSIKHLRLIGMPEIFHIERLMTLLPYLPYLESLHIIANTINFVPTNNNNNNNSLPLSNHISFFRLNINQFTLPFVQFTAFLLNLIPCVEELELICRTRVENLDYLDFYQWIPIIKCLNRLKKVTLKINPTNGINKEVWDKNCQRLTKLMTQNHIILRFGDN